MESICFAPSLQQNLRENARVTVAIAVVSCLLIWFLTSLPRPLVIALGLGGGIALFAFYTGRFYVCAPRRVEYSDKTLTLEYHSGKITELVWSEVETASFTNEYGLRWKFRTAHLKIIFRDDGFTGMEWYRASRLIYERLVAASIQVSTDMIGENFLS